MFTFSKTRLAALAAVPITILALHPSRSAPPCAPGESGLVVPEGFCASLVADGLGPVRQLAVSPSGDLYAAISGGSRLFGGGGVAAFRDRNGDGKPDEHASFGPRGGNDVKFHEGHLYLALQDRVLRWSLPAGALAPAGEPETIVADLPVGGNHNAKSLAFPGGNVMLVNVGSATNSCQRKDRAPGSKGLDPCRELERRAGIWQFAADRAGQHFADGKRFATGLRNTEALAVQPGTGAVYGAVMGRDQLGDSWGMSPEVNANNPAEELARIDAGDDFGWPYCYYSNEAHKKVLAPEYGGDGHEVGRCAKAKNPEIAFPGHWAPLALAFVTGKALGAKYDGGLFIAFHGSWNRAPLPQAGYRVVFAPFADGHPAGQYETFATGAGGPTSLRASGLALGKDGALYISADDNEKIWRVAKR
ncbi:MAG: PQQ-dependent sugar dehydrogenase [Gemmatimonadales bacterium]